MTTDSQDCTEALANIAPALDPLHVSPSFVGQARQIRAIQPHAVTADSQARTEAVANIAPALDSFQVFPRSRDNRNRHA